MYKKISGVRFTVSFLALLLVVLLSACSSTQVSTQPQPITPTTTTTTTTTVTTATPKPSTTITSAPKALTGTFHQKVSYQTPESVEDVDFVFSVSSGSVTNLALSATPIEQNSKKYQSKFMDAIASKVVGMKISDIGTFDRVGGASLTTKAFNQAVTRLKAQS